jgi:predicted RNA-binding Zn-ribbon protein involved in translation (DUF1610 family)
MEGYDSIRNQKHCPFCSTPMIPNPLNRNNKHKTLPLRYDCENCGFMGFWSK